MPHVLRQADASERIAAGDQELAVLLAKYIKFVFDCYIEVEEKLQGTNSTDEDAGPQHSTSRSAPRRGSDHPETAEAPEPQVTVAVTSTAERTATLTSDQKSIAVTRKPQTAKTRSKSPAAKAGVERSSAFLRPRPSSTKANALQPVPAPIRASSPPRISRNSSGLNKKVNERARSPTRATAEARIAAYPRDPLYSERITVQRAQQARSPGREPALSAPMRAEIILWLEALGVYSASVSYRRLHYTPVAGVASSVRRPDLPPLEDPWCNGVLLCELAAVLCKTGDRSLVKEV